MLKSWLERLAGESNILSSLEYYIHEWNRSVGSTHRKISIKRELQNNHENKRRKESKEKKHESGDQSFPGEVPIALSYIIKDMYICWLRDKIQAIHEKMVLLFRFQHAQLLIFRIFVVILVSSLLQLSCLLRWVSQLDRVVNAIAACWSCISQPLSPLTAVVMGAWPSRILAWSL